MLQNVLKAEVQSVYLADVTDSIQCSTSNNKNVPYTRVASPYSMVHIPLDNYHKEKDVLY